MSNKQNTNHQLSITGYSTALFSTWYFIDEMGILFDCGDGVTAGLLQKARKVKHVFISHADRDHLAGLLQFNQLNARPELNIYYPAGCGSFKFLSEFSSRFDPHTGGTNWVPIEPGTEIRIRNDLVVRAISNRHVVSKTGTRSLSYFVDAVSKKLKSEFIGKSGSELAAIRNELGDQHLTIESRKTKLVYSGDTPIEMDGRYDHTELLIHEATFLTSSEIDPDNPHRNKHSSLDQVIGMVAESNIERLILGHFSSRYDSDQIDDAIKMECNRHGIRIPVYCVSPSRIGRGILEGCPVFDPAI